ncbi:MAG: DUF983 domain-containing protein [Rickettsiales bacterium]|nr:DUF983 domain-containing protein [Rickettsiales bacterium]
MSETLSPLKVAIKDCCPRCGEKTLYKNLLSLADECSSCGLNFSDHDSGDGPAFFTITILGFVITGGALFLEIFYRTEYWIQALIWPPVMMVLTPLCLRFFKSYLIAWRYKTELLNEDKDAS